MHASSTRVQGLRNSAGRLDAVGPAPHCARRSPSSWMLGMRVHLVWSSLFALRHRSVELSMDKAAAARKQTTESSSLTVSEVGTLSSARRALIEALVEHPLVQPRVHRH